MAVTDSNKALATFDKRTTYLAAGFSALLAGGWATTLILYWALSKDLSGALTAAILLKTTGALVAVILSVQLLKQCRWAHQALLLIHLMVVAWTLLIMLGSMLWGVPDWWASYVPWPMPAVILPVMFLSAGAIVLLATASAPSSRLRYATMVVISVVAAICLAVAGNMIAQDDYLRIDVETLGRYGPSDRTKTVLSDLDEPLILTCVYTSEGKASSADEFRPRVLDYLDRVKETMRVMGKDVTVANVTTAGEKLALHDRLSAELKNRYKSHEGFLKKFVVESSGFIKQIDAAQAEWQGMGEGSYLAAWGGVVGSVTDNLKQDAEAIRKAGLAASEAAEGTTLPDFAAVVSEVSTSLETSIRGMKEISALVSRASKIPNAIATNSGIAVDSLVNAGTAVKAAHKIVAEASDEDLAKPAELLERFATAAQDATRKILVAGVVCQDIGGEENRDWINSSSYFSIVTTGGFMAQKIPISYILKNTIAGTISKDAATAKEIIKNAKPDYQKQYITDSLKVSVEGWQKDFEAIREMAHKGIIKLTEVDEPTKAIFAKADKGELFGGLTKRMEDLVTEAKALDEVKTGSLVNDLAQDNIVIIEVGDETKVATFDEIWPQNAPMVVSDRDAEPKRLFNADSAISSSILGMSHGAFGKVLIVYYQPQVPPQMARMLPPPPIPHQALGKLRSVLEEVNFKVDDWNLAEGPYKQNGDEADANDLPKILIVLPMPGMPPMMMMPNQPQPPTFGQAELALLKGEIDSGTAAIFLSAFSPPRQSPLGMDMEGDMLVSTYLADDWGVEVKDKHLVVVGVPDEKRIGEYRIDGDAPSFLPISTFSDHVVGRPLQGQRVMWRLACPLTFHQSDGVTVEPLLTIPAGRSEIWASGDVRELIRMLYDRENDGLFTPGKIEGDMLTPLDLAVACSRTADEKTKRAAGRIVVLGLGYSFMDDMLTQTRTYQNAKGAIVIDDPPTLNTDLVVNSAYWLIGREAFIAAGPGKIKPIKNIGPTEEIVLRIVCLAGLPLAMLALGALVMFIRKR